MSFQPKEEVAHETANKLLMNAIGAVSTIDCPANPVLVAAHMLAAKLDSMETYQLEVLRDLKECLGFLVARPDGSDSSEVPTDDERDIMYRALVEEYMARFNKIGTIGVLAEGRLDIGAAQCRFKKITRSKSIEAVNVPTEHEREVIYRALEADYIEHNAPENIEEMDVDLLRLKKIAGL